MDTYLAEAEELLATFPPGPARSAMQELMHYTITRNK